MAHFYTIVHRGCHCEGISLHNITEVNLQQKLNVFLKHLQKLKLKQLLKVHDFCVKKFSCLPL